MIESLVELFYIDENKDKIYFEIQRNTVAMLNIYLRKIYTGWNATYKTLKSFLANFFKDKSLVIFKISSKYYSF